MEMAEQVVLQFESLKVADVDLAATPTPPTSTMVFNTFEQLLRGCSPALRELHEVKEGYEASPFLLAHLERKGARYKPWGPSASYQTWLANLYEKDGKVSLEKYLRGHYDEVGMKMCSFLDLGAAPGGWSRWLLGWGKEVRGVGVELPRVHGGRQVVMDGWDKEWRSRYSVLRQDLLLIMKEPLEVEELASMDLVLAGAIPNEVFPDTPPERSFSIFPNPVLLTLNELYLAFLCLKPNGCVISIALKKAYVINCEIVLLLRSSFQQLIPRPSPGPYSAGSTYQIIALGFKEEARQAGLRRIGEAIRKLEGLSEASRIEELGLSLFSELEDESVLFDRNKYWLLNFYNPLWKYQSEMLQVKLKELERKDALMRDSDRALMQMPRKQYQGSIC